jgi:hypothetical protein
LFPVFSLSLHSSLGLSGNVKREEDDNRESFLLFSEWKITKENKLARDSKRELFRELMREIMRELMRELIRELIREQIIEPMRKYMKVLKKAKRK